mmetsp:Transcript_6823/g.10443  ORF Transcript_6823/g.10443 Transcript_6823/m.10443 type:complete len:474 (+) Transcript_6823:70-1491(+)
MIRLADKATIKNAKLKCLELASFRREGLEENIKELKLNFFESKHVAMIVEKATPLMIGQAMTVFEFIISAMEKHVRSMRRTERKTSMVTHPMAAWDFTSANRFQLGFLHGAQDNLRELLTLVDVLFHVDLNKKCIFLARGKRILRTNDLEAALMDFERITELFVNYDFEAMIRSLLNSSAKILSKRCRYLDESNDGNRLRSFVSTMHIEAMKIESKQKNLLRAIEFRSIVRKAQDGKQEGCIYFCDISSLNSVQLELLMEVYRCSSKGQLMRKVFYRYALYTCREILRSLQAFANQNDFQQYPWCSVHNSCYAAGGLFMAACEQKPAKSSFLPGFGYEVISSWLKDSFFNWCSWPLNMKSEYLKWRDSYGRRAPNHLLVTASSKVSMEFKHVICLESCFNSSWALQRQLDFLFEDREGDLRKFDIADVPLALRHQKGSRLPLLLLPVTSSGTAKDIECCQAPTSHVCFASSSI